MAYYRPLQRKDGNWDYACTNGAGTFPLGYCAGYRELNDEGSIKGMFPQSMLDRDNDRMRPFKEKYHAGGHATAAEAMNCHREYQLDQFLEFEVNPDGNEQKRCGVCGTWTTAYASIRGEHFRHWPLCAAHHDRESVEKLWAKEQEKEVAEK